MSFFSRLFVSRQAELDEEIQAHLQMDIADRKDRGESYEQARAAAMREFGNVAIVKDVTREMWGWVGLERLGQDLRFALRQLRKSPIFTMTVTATLALGLGATVAMFTVVDRVLLRPLPYTEAQQLIEIKETGKKGSAPVETPFLDLQQWRERSHTLQAIAFYSANRQVSFLEGKSEAIQVSAPKISANLFQMLGVQPSIGHGFDAQPDGVSIQPREAQTLILSDAVWKTSYGSDAQIIGKTVKLNGESYVVAGVMPPGFTFPFDAGSSVVWTPVVLGDTDAVRTMYITPNYEVVARLKPGVTLDSAQSELKVIQAEVAKAYTDPYEREQVNSVQVQRYDDSLMGGDLRRSLLALFGASGVLWLIACVNAASLMLARATARQREIAVRGALGASRWRIVQQLVVEGMVLSVLSSTIGLGLGTLILKLFERGLSNQFHMHEKMIPNPSVIGMLLGLTAASALLCSAWPAMVAARASIEPALRQGCLQSSATPVQYRTRALLVVTQIAMSLTLLVGCGLLLRTIYALRHVPLGFRTDHVIVADMSIPAYKFAGRNMTTELYQPLVDRVKHLPGVQSASLITGVPLGTKYKMTFTFEIDGDGARRRDMSAQMRAVGPEMQRVLGFRMLKGRFFNEGDTPSSLPVAVVNRAFVKAYYGGDEDPGKILGQSFLRYSENRRAVIVGVLDDERQLSVADQSQPEIQVCIPQITLDTDFYRGAEGWGMDLIVRTERSSPPATSPRWSRSSKTPTAASSLLQNY
jgi:predicted permease